MKIISLNLTAAALCVLSALLPAQASAQTSGPWKWQGGIYAYLPTIGGKTTFPQAAAGSDVSVDADQILGNLKGVFMGSLETNNGRWGAFTDVMYMDIGDSKSGTRNIAIGRRDLPAGATADANFDLKGWVWTLGGSYRLVTSPNGTMDVIAGARLLDIKQTLGWSVTGNIGSITLPGRAGNLGASLSNWDGIVGVKGRLVFGEDRKWFAPYYVDVGTGNSDRTWQAMAGVGYAFHWGDVLAAWRYLDYKMKSGKPVEELNFNGPVIAAVFHW
jgi:hypothetical protein